MISLLLFSLLTLLIIGIFGLTENSLDFEISERGFYIIIGGNNEDNKN